MSSDLLVSETQSNLVPKPRAISAADYYNLWYMYNEHTVMYVHILKLPNRSEYSTSNVSGLDSCKEIR